MRYPASEKLEIVRTVEASHLPTRQTLKLLGIPSSTYCDWYARWNDGGLDPLADRFPQPRSVWNRIPDKVREDVVDFALEHEDLTHRELAVKYTDEKRYFVSESSVYRILSSEDLITAPAHVVVRAAPSRQIAAQSLVGQRADRLDLPEGDRSRPRRAFGTTAGSVSRPSSTTTAGISSPRSSA